MESITAYLLEVGWIYKIMFEQLLENPNQTLASKWLQGLETLIGIVENKCKIVK